MGYRFTILATVFGLIYSLLLFNLYKIQIINGENFEAQAESQSASPEFLRANRGGIYFTDKENKIFGAVLNKDFPLVYAVPTEIDDAQEAAAVLSPILDIEISKIREKLSKKDDQYELLVHKASSELASKIKDQKIKGIYVRSESDRFYPLGDRASHILGFVSPGEDSDQIIGRYGLEKLYEESLAGKNGEAKDGEIIKPEAGEDLYLTLDENIQIQASRIIKNLVEKHRATGGSIIVQDPKTGKILASESLPSFNPNKFSDYPLENFLNPVVQKIYEPGSVFKVVTMASGLDAKKITPDTTYNDKGSITVSGKKIQNWDLQAHGVVTMTNVIEKSLNTGAAFAESKIGHTLFKTYLEKFGFSDKTGIDLPGELSGDLRRLNSKAPVVAFATASFGQGVAVTPLELLNAVSAIANGGTLMRPYINSTNGPKEIRRVISAEASRQTTAMMVSALDKAEVGHIENYSLAGKTGTAQVPDFKKGGYTDEVINTYVGFGPTTNPRFTILIKLDEPAGAPLAGTTVVPAFRELAQFILNYYNIPPDRINAKP
jgi:cell division protein FtsI/penicillin-binding protein 2